jgi:very-short-patch-repair endonuclease
VSIHLESNVWDFVERAREQMAALLSFRWADDITVEAVESGISSPIEQMFYVACSALCAGHLVELNPDPEYSNGEAKPGWGIYIHPQVKIGKFKADFVLSQHGIGPEEFLSKVVVELDGHDFHDRNKYQRSYEKSRDRFFIKNGYRVIHYTGSDVVADPFKVAFEALDFVGLSTVTGIKEYDPKDPLGMLQ